MTFNSFFFLTSDASSYTNADSEGKLLIISSKSDEYLIDTLIHQRKLFSSIKIDQIDVEDEVEIQNLIETDLSVIYDEFWIITREFSNNELFSELILLLNNENIYGSIVSSKINELSNETLSILGIASCNIEIRTNKDSLFTFGYSDPNNLSLLLENELPQIESYYGELDYFECELRNDAYSLLNLTSINSKSPSMNTPILFQPYYKSNIIVSPLTLNSSQSDDSESEIETEDESSDAFTIFSKINQQSQVSFVDFLALTSLLNSQNWEPIPLNNVIETLNAQPNEKPNINDNMNVELIQTILSGSLILTILSMLFLILRKYGIFLIGSIIGFLALFRVPSRKISVMEVYNNDTRQQILDILNQKKSQGETIRNLSRNLAIPLPTILWHIQILKDFELISKEKVRRESVIVSLEFIKDFDRYGKILKEFELTFKTHKSKVFYEYLLDLNENDQFSMKSLINYTNYSSRTIIRYIKKLRQLEIIVEVTKTGNGKKYKISPKFFSKLKELN